MDPYQLIMAELMRGPKPAAPMFTPEQINARIAQNNDLVSAGILGQLAGDERIQGLGGSVFRNALANRQEARTERGMFDPLSGVTATDPEFTDNKEQGRRGQLLQKALNYQLRKEEGEANRLNRSEIAEQNRLLRLSLAGGSGSRGASAAIGAAPAGMGRVPAGYRLNAQGELEPIPGGPQASKASEAAAKKQLAFSNQMQTADRVMNTVDEAINKAGVLETGLPGSVMRRIPGTDAFDLNKAVDTIKANLGFAELAAMRAASPTGGALGQVAIKELDMLQATIANLDTAQNRETVLNNLRKIRSHYATWKTAMRTAHGEGFAPTPVPTPGPAATGTTAVPPGQPGIPSQSGRTRMRYNPATGQIEPVQ